jgi:hypothetical protein
MELSIGIASRWDFYIFLWPSCCKHDMDVVNYHWHAWVEQLDVDGGQDIAARKGDKDVKGDTF